MTLKSDVADRVTRLMEAAPFPWFFVGEWALDLALGRPERAVTEQKHGQGAERMKISRHRAEHYVWGNRCDGWILAERDELSVIHERMPPGTSEIRHFHRFARQFFFVLEGELVIEADGREVKLGKHEGMEIPPGTAHQVMNRSDRAAEFLVISHPAARGDRVPMPGKTDGTG